MNSLTKQKETHRLRKWTHGCPWEGTVMDFGKVMHTLLYLTDCVAHGALLSVICQPGWEGVWGRMDTCICIYVAESLHCSPETITVLLISYAPIQTAFGVRKKKKINLINKIIFKDGKHHCRKWNHFLKVIFKHSIRMRTTLC